MNGLPHVSGQNRFLGSLENFLESGQDTRLGRHGCALDETTLDAATAGEIEIQDMSISGDVLLAQADIARAAGRQTLANILKAAQSWWMCHKR